MDPGGGFWDFEGFHHDREGAQDNEKKLEALGGRVDERVGERQKNILGISKRGYKRIRLYARGKDLQKIK